MRAAAALLLAGLAAAAGVNAQAVPAEGAPLHAVKSASPEAKAAPAPAAAAAKVHAPAREVAPTEATDPLVEAAPLVPGLIVSLSYATPQNITGHPLYPPGARCLLRRSVAERLAQAARALQAKGLRLVAWDCTRPAAAQQALFTAFPHPGSVADPQRGSLHQRGVAIDLGLAALDGSPVPLPTPFDAFGPKAHADAALPEGPAKNNRDALRTALYEAGFRVNPREWWHFSRLYGWRWPQAPAGGEL